MTPKAGRQEATAWSYAVEAAVNDSYDVTCQLDVLSPTISTLGSALNLESPILVVTTPSVNQYYGAQIHRYFAALGSNTSVSFLTLACSEAEKSIDRVLEVCNAAAQAGLARQSQVVCIGGGVALDIVGLAATLFRRGIPHVRVPTTLIGMIDAGVGVKNAVNFAGAKSLLGTFTPPQACLIDPGFLATLPDRHLRCGLAEMIKVAIVCSPDLFDNLEARAARHPGGSCGRPIDWMEDIRLSVEWTLAELQANLFERKDLFTERYARKLDFGHTFSPHIEVVLGHRLLHGEAVAVDIAICAMLANRLGLLDASSRDRILNLLLRTGLPIHCAGIDPAAMHESLQSVVRHRDGNLNLAIPDRIGGAIFIRQLNEISEALLGTVWHDLELLACDTVGPVPQRQVASQN